MKQSEKTDTTLVRTETVYDNGYTYRYLLFLRQDPHTTYRPPLYSIRAELTEDGKPTHAEEVTDAFFDPGRALIFFSLCHEHLVLPGHLLEILMDFEH